jgi:hypothetical protein
MSAHWHFTVVGDVVQLRARFEGPGGMVGDAFDEIRPGQSLHGLSFDELKKAGAGVVEIADDGKAKIGRAET